MDCLLISKIVNKLTRANYHVHIIGGYFIGYSLPGGIQAATANPQSLALSFTPLSYATTQLWAFNSSGFIVSQGGVCTSSASCYILSDSG